MRNLLFLLILIPCRIFSQYEPDLIIYSDSDRSALLIGFVKDTNEVLAESDFPMVKDSLAYFIARKFDLEVYAMESDSLPATFKVYLSRENTRQLLKSSGMIFRDVKYGYGATSGSEALTQKYGIQYLNGGCRVPARTEYERMYENQMYKLLEIRNGKNWQLQYLKDEEKGL